MPKAKPKKARTFCEKGHELTFENTIRRRNGPYIVRSCRTCRNEYQKQRRDSWKERRYRREDCFCAYCREKFELTYQAVRDTEKRGGLMVCPACKPTHKLEQRPLAVVVEEHHRSYWRKHPTLSFAEVVEIAREFASWEEETVRAEG